MPQIRKIDSIKFGEYVEQLELLHIASGNVKWWNNFGKLFGSVHEC